MATTYGPRNTGASYNPDLDTRPIDFTLPPLGVDLATADRVNTDGYQYAICPLCAATRKGSNQQKKTLRLSPATGYWTCFHCSAHGLARVNPDGSINDPGRNGGTGPATPSGARRPVSRVASGPVAEPLVNLADVAPRVYNLPKRAPSGPESLTEEAWSWLTDRGLSAAVVEAFGLGSTAYPVDGIRHPAITIPYRRGGQVVNVKTRMIDGKDHAMVRGGERILLNRDALATAGVIVFTEGEWDALAVQMTLDAYPTDFAGYAVTSVPNGSPKSEAGASAHLSYLGEAAGDLDHDQRIVLAGDDDDPGRWLTNAIAERLGPLRSRRVTWPDGCKDANEVLLAHGVEGIRDALLAAAGYPIKGVVELGDVMDEMLALYEDGPDNGLATGLGGAIDELYRLVPGTVTFITGPPGCGKSSVLDHMIVSAATLHGWHATWCSPEKQPVSTHFATLATVLVGKPYMKNKRYPELNQYQQTREEAAAARGWVAQHNAMVMARKDDGGMADIPYLITKLEQCVRKYGSKFVVLDPWNRFAKDRPSYMTETEYTAGIIHALGTFAIEHQVVVIVVAHPAKDGMRRNADGTYHVVTADQIAGSASFSAMADFVLSVWRDDRTEEAIVEAGEEFRRPSAIHVQKVRNDFQGVLGAVKFQLGKFSRRFSEVVPVRGGGWEGVGAINERVEAAFVPAPDDDDLGF